jgi:hypothetical protein
LKTLVEGLSPPYAPPCDPSAFALEEQAARSGAKAGWEYGPRRTMYRLVLTCWGTTQRNTPPLHNYSWPCPPTPRSTSNKNGAAAPSTICAGSASSSNGATLLLGFGRVTRTAVVQSDHVADRRHPLVAVRLRLRRELVVGRGAAAGESRRKLEGRRSGKGAAKTIPEHPVHVRGHGVAA